MKTVFYLSIALLPIAFYSCDKVDDPFPPNLDVIDSTVVWDDSVTSASNNGVRYVLMEEFTGHTCSNCPAAAVKVEDLRKNYGEKFIPIAIHATEAFAAPADRPGAPGGYQTDHRTDESLEYENETAFGVAALPTGLVSRSKESINKDKWKAEADKIFSNPGATQANILITNYFDDSSKTFKVSVDIEWLEAYTGDMNLQIQVLEDSVVDWQLDGLTNIPDYVFKHMFRGSVNGAWGTELVAANKGEHTIISFSRKIEAYLGRGNTLANFPKTDFSSFSIVAFIYKRSPVFEVMQVNEAHLTNSP
jgi:hypothetical protein